MSGLAECCRRTSRMERLPRYAALMSAVRPKLVCRSTLAPRSSSILTISSWSLAAAACSRAAVESRLKTELSALTGPPLRSHSATFCSSPHCADWWISMGREAGELTVGSPASGAAVGAAAAAGCGGAACCRMSSAMAVWPLISACCRAVWPSLSSSSVLALARSRALTHATSPSSVARNRAVLSSMPCRSGLAECCSRTSRIAMWP
eukprot:scaffold40643_cov66-Phaeocystis_antarctica.AAC.5